MITIKNNQGKIYVDTKGLEVIAQKMLDTLDYSDFDLGIWLTTNKTIRLFNKQYRKQDKATDILSFSYHENLKPGQRIQPQIPEDKNLGDLIISLQYAKKDAPRWKHSFEEHLVMLLAHGIAHLLNYDHETDEEYKQMSAVEKKLLSATSNLKLAQR